MFLHLVAPHNTFVQVSKHLESQVDDGISRSHGQAHSKRVRGTYER